MGNINMLTCYFTHLYVHANPSRMARRRPSMPTKVLMAHLSWQRPMLRANALGVEVAARTNIVKAEHVCLSPTQHNSTHSITHKVRSKADMHNMLDAMNTRSQPSKQNVLLLDVCMVNTSQNGFNFEQTQLFTNNTRRVYRYLQNLCQPTKQPNTVCTRQDEYE